MFVIKKTYIDSKIYFISDNVHKEFFITSITIIKIITFCIIHYTYTLFIRYEINDVTSEFPFTTIYHTYDFII